MTNAPDERYELVSILGKPALFTSLRIAHASVPEGLHKYELRQGGGSFCAVQIGNQIVFDHMGTLLMRDKLELDEGGYLSIEDSDLVFHNSGMCELGEYMRHTEREQQGGKISPEKTKRGNEAR